MDVRDELMEHVPRLRRYARALINNRDLADDLVQDTLERALNRPPRDGGNLRAWLLTLLDGQTLQRVVEVAHFERAALLRRHGEFAFVNAVVVDGHVNRAR